MVQWSGVSKLAKKKKLPLEGPYFVCGLACGVLNVWMGTDNKNLVLGVQNPLASGKMKLLDDHNCYNLALGNTAGTWGRAVIHPPIIV